jgi:hypothetical protein
VYACEYVIEKKKRKEEGFNLFNMHGAMRHTQTLYHHDLVRIYLSRQIMLQEIDQFLKTKRKNHVRETRQQGQGNTMNDLSMYICLCFSNKSKIENDMIFIG